MIPIPAPAAIPLIRLVRKQGISPIWLKSSMEMRFTSQIRGERSYLSMQYAAFDVCYERSFEELESV